MSNEDLLILLLAILAVVQHAIIWFIKSCYDRCHADYCELRDNPTNTRCK